MSSSLARDLVLFDVRGDRDRDRGGEESVWEALSTAALNQHGAGDRGRWLVGLALWVGLFVYVPVLAVGCALVGALVALLGMPGLLGGLGWVAAVGAVAVFTEPATAASIMSRIVPRGTGVGSCTVGGGTT